MNNNKGQLSIIAIALIVLVLSGVTYVVVKNVFNNSSSVTGNVVAGTGNAVDNGNSATNPNPTLNGGPLPDNSAPAIGCSTCGDAPAIPPILDTGGY